MIYGVAVAWAGFREFVIVTILAFVRSRFTVHGLGQRPQMIRGPLKTKERAREKVAAAAATNSAN